MANHSGLSGSTVGRIWKAFRLKPHLSETFKLSTDPLFIEKVRDVVGLYIDPPDKAVVLCVDEKSQVQALDRSQQMAEHIEPRSSRARHLWPVAGCVSIRIGGLGSGARPGITLVQIRSAATD